MRDALRAGAPYWAIAVLVGACLLALVAVAALRGTDTGTSRAWAEARATAGACFVDPARSRDVTDCFRIAPGVYRLRFARSVARGTVVATRGACCPGDISASLVDERTAQVAFPVRTRFPVVFSIAVP